MTESSIVPAKPDKPGNQAFDKRVRRHVTGRIRAYYAITAPRAAKQCRQELTELGFSADGLVVDAGGVVFHGRFVDCQRANLHLRTATRILMRIDAFDVTNVRQLEKRTAEIAWELFLRPGALPDIKVRSRRSRLYHSDLITRGLLTGIAARQGDRPGSATSILPQTVFARLVDDRLSLSLDSSGDPLYKRGLKRGPARAPIRETLAAAILMAAGYDPRHPLVDPMCGSGTFSLEAAMLAKGMAPGVNRTFAFMDWPAFRKGQWAFIKRQAESQTCALDRARIFASDRDGGACERLVATIDRNGLTDAVVVAQKDLFDCVAGDYGGRGLVVINPPYGIRIGSPSHADDLFEAIGRHLAQRFTGWSVALIAPRSALARRLPFAVDCQPLRHGGLTLTLVLGKIK